jgi:hypothetical protein
VISQKNTTPRIGEDQKIPAVRSNSRTRRSRGVILRCASLRIDRGAGRRTSNLRPIPRQRLNPMRLASAIGPFRLRCAPVSRYPAADMPVGDIVLAAAVGRCEHIGAAPIAVPGVPGPHRKRSRSATTESAADPSAAHELCGHAFAGRLIPGSGGVPWSSSAVVTAGDIASAADPSAAI